MKPVCCPGCGRRSTMKDKGVVYSEAAQQGDVISWQCVYCGAVCEQTGPRAWSVTHYAAVTVQPGELEAMRQDRGARR